MSIEEQSATIPAIEDKNLAETPANEMPSADGPNSPAQSRRKRWYTPLLSPLWLCLLVALIIRIWLVVHTHGVIDGDEAMVGIQAQHILHGEWPVYYYGQAYMGSLEAYLMALLFAIAGSSVWTMRAEPTLLSLVVVFLTWKMAGALADAARLSSPARRRFQFWAALFAAIPPLYDTVVELRTLGGYIETFVLMLLLLLSTLRLIQRWSSGISQRELVLRWAGIGFVVGLGLWIDPLISSAIGACAIWIAGYALMRLITQRKQSTPAQQPLVSMLKGLSVGVGAIGAGLIGCAPALLWGASHNWGNVRYILNAGGGNVPTNRLTMVTQLTKLYTTCIAPRVVGGSLPVPPHTAVHWHLLTLSVLAGILPLLASLAAVGLSFTLRQPLFMQYRQLVGLPLVFGACSAALFCVSKISTPGLYFNCLNIDNVGRFASPLLLALPFLFAALLTIGGSYATGYGRRERVEEQAADPVQNASADRFSRAGVQILQILLLGIVVLYFGIQSVMYVQSNAGYTFQTSGCTDAPANNDPIITYLRDQHIHYAWSTFWIGNPIIFKSNEEIIVADPRIITQPQVFKSRLPAYTAAVLDSDRPSVLTLISASDKYPQLLKMLDAENITWHAARFSSEPGIDLLVVTPLNRPISPFIDSSLGAWFGGC